MINLLFLTTLSHLSTNFDNIQSDCEFNILRFKRFDVWCQDMGKNSEYCNHNNLAKEFLVMKEIGLNNIEKITIKPRAMYENINGFDYKMADFKYFFKCSKGDSDALLTLQITPTKNYDKSFYQILSEILLLFVFIILPLLCLFSALGCGKDSNNRSDNFWLGYSASSNNNIRRRVYCE